MPNKSKVPKNAPEDGKYTCSECGKTVTSDEVVKTTEYVFHPECARRATFEADEKRRAEEEAAAAK